MTSKFNNVYIGDAVTIASVYEKDGPIAADFDLVYDKDLYYGCDTFEKAEEKLLHDSIKRLIDKSKLQLNDINYVISGDLQNQILASTLAVSNQGISSLGIYSACASFVEGLIIASMFVNSTNSNIIVSSSSHNLAAEKQYRFPIEYGALRRKVNTCTASGSVAALISRRKSNIKI